MLPYPNKDLNPNKRVNYHVKAEVFKATKNEAYTLAKKAGLTGIQQRKLRLLFSPPDRRRRDLDNMHASMKAALDGIALAIGCDDSEFCPIIIDRSSPVKGGSVLVEFYE
nr:MAG TPA: endodeoxyribonuclease RUS [Caudoviricetes sp.]